MVLMIEDDPDTRELTTDFLGMSGIELTTAGTAAEGIALAIALRPKAILLDLTLPDATGYEVRERLLADARTRDIPVLAMTGHTLEPEDRARFSQVFRKPVNLDVVVAWLKKLG